MPKIAVFKKEFDLGNLKEKNVFWLPMLSIRYKVGFKKYEYLFDTFLAPTLNKRDLYIVLLRNPRDLTLENVEEFPISGKVFHPTKGGEEILEDILDFRNEISSMLEEAKERMGKTTLKMALLSILWIVSPESITEYDTNSLYYNMLYFAGKLLDRIGLSGKKKPKVLGEELIYYPIIIDYSKNIAYEPALKIEKSESLTALIELPEIKNILKK